MMPKMIVSRRGVLDLGLTAAASVALPARGEAISDRTISPQPGDLFVAVDDAMRAPLRAETIRSGAMPVRAWPLEPTTGVVRDGALFNQILLFRLPAQADNEHALVAFSAICQHASCVVSDWLTQNRLLRCPCHGSEYDPARGGMVVAGPAPLPLPMLPVRVTDGVVTVAGAFSARVGGHTGRTD
jgi:rieske iron-sulfur protein